MVHLSYESSKYFLGVVVNWQAVALSIVKKYGYFGVFIITLLTSATIFIPVPSQLYVFLLAPVLNPVLMSLAAGLGSAIGELTGYGIGLGGEKIIIKKYPQYKDSLKAWKRKFKERGFILLFLFAVTPLPDDIVGIVAGLLKYDVKKFLIAVFLGKTLMFLLVAYAGKWAFGFFM